MNFYDKLYCQIDMKNRPFGFDNDYMLWLTKQLKGEILKYINKNCRLIDIGGGTDILASFIDIKITKSNYFNYSITN